MMPFGRQVFNGLVLICAAWSQLSRAGQGRAGQIPLPVCVRVCGSRKGFVEATTQRTTAQLEWSPALFPARDGKVDEVGGLFIDWPQHKHTH